MDGAATLPGDSKAAGFAWASALCLTAACGLLLVALGDTAARAALGIAELIFWIGLLVLFVPIAARLFWSGVSGRERFLLVAVLGLAMYGVKYLHSPLYFSFVDEFMHWRTASDILTSHHLFHGNSLLPVSPLYPSLEMVTSALTSLSGLSLFSAGVLMLVAARLILVLALYLFYEQVSGSARVAGIGTLLYMTNPNFLFFDAQFSYESFALPIALFVLFILARRPSSPISHRLGLSLALLPAILMVATTHHLTSYALAAFLLLWTATTALCAGSLRTAFLQGPGGAALLLIVTALLWLVFVATVTIGYLAPNFMAALHELVGLISGESGARQLFRSPNTGHFSPVWERVVGLGAVVCVLLGLPGGVLRIWRSHRINAAAVALAVATLAYPVTLALRLTQSGAEISGRSSEFIFVPVAYVLALGIVEYRLPWKLNRLKPLLFLPWAAALLVGGVVVGWPPWARMPGPYLVVADSRSIEMRGLDTAEWARTYLGQGNRVATDRTNALLMGGYGEQRVATHLQDGVDVSVVFLSRRLGAGEIAALRDGRIRYLVVDKRLSTGVPAGGPYFEVDIPRTRPISPTVLAKFDHLPRVSRIYDSGNIVVYDVGALSNAS